MPGRDRAEAGVERDTRTVCATGAVRLALEQFVNRCRREEIGARIVRGYRERPQDDMAIAWAEGSSVLIVTRSNAVLLLTWIIVAYEAYHSQDSYVGRFPTGTYGTSPPSLGDQDWRQLVDEHDLIMSRRIKRGWASLVRFFYPSGKSTLGQRISEEPRYLQRRWFQ